VSEESNMTTEEKDDSKEDSRLEESTNAETAGNAEKGEAVEEKTNWGKEILSWFIMVAAILAAIWFLTNFIIVNARIPSGSMENTIMTGDRLIGERFAYWFSNPKRGDIVLFHWPVEPDTIYIKRVIGLPGETVTIKEGKIYINNSKTPLKEDYLKEEWTVENDGYTFHVPKDSYLMLGDNRNNSADSRYWAEEALEDGVAKTEEQADKYTYVKKSAIIGKAWFRYVGGFKNLTNTAHY
jgi:signal peptidase I